MNKKIRGRYRFLMHVDFRRKNFLKIQAVSYFLCFFLLCAMSIWIDNMGKIQRAETAERYGSWHYGLIGSSESEMELIEKNKMLQASGRAAAYSGIYTEEKYYLGDIGTMEASLLPLCGIKLISGNLPENANEIAFEQNALEQLGVPYAVDEEITLKIGESEESLPREFTFILCGILQSNSAYTEAGSYLPVAIVNEEGAAEFAANGQQALFIQMVEGCDEFKVWEELKEAVFREFSETLQSDEDSKWIQNAFVYGENFRRGNTVGARRLISVIGYVAIFALGFTYIYRERSRTNILRMLGMLEREILLLFIGEQIIIWFIAMLSGLVLGGAVIQLLLKYYIQSQNLRISISFPITYIRAICLISSIVLVAGCLVGELCAKIKTSYRRGKDMDYRLLDKGGLEPLNGDIKKALLKREFKVRKHAYISLFCMQVLMLLAVAFCVTWMYRHYKEYRFNRNSYICDYIIQGSSVNSTVWSAGRNMDNGFLDRVKNMEGVEKVETIYWNTQVEILDEEVRNGDYYRAMENYNLNKESAFTSSLITLEMGEDMIEELAAQVDVGKWDPEKLEAGEEVIIYLPLQRPINEGIARISYSQYSQNRENYDAEYDAWQEKQIGVGDILLIQIGETEREVKIGGIIYDTISLKNINNWIIIKPYDIFCGNELFLELAGEKVSSGTYVYMEGGAQSTFMAEQMENMLHRNHVSWINIRDKVRPMLEYHRNGMLLGGLLLSGFGILFGFVLITYLNKEMEIVAYKNRLLLDIGADFEEKKPYLHRYHWSMGLGTLTVLFLDGLVVLITTKVLGKADGFYIAWQELWESYPLMLGLQLLLFWAELRILLRIMKKNEKISKNIYYFAP